MGYLNHPKQAIYYLLERGHLSRKSLVDGDAIAHEISSRHKNVAVTAGSEGGHFLKSIQFQMPMASATLQREAALYLTIRQDQELAFLSELMPKLHSFDPQRGMLVIEHIPHSENLGAFLRRTGNLSETILARLGNALAICHSQTQQKLLDENRKSRFRSFLPVQLPWALMMPLAQNNLIVNLSAANAQMLRILQQYPDFSSRLETLRGNWNASSLIHGDMKFDNCLLSFPQGQDSDPIIKLIDWEIADIGDPLWDVAGILQSCLLLWAASSAKDSQQNGMPSFHETPRLDISYSLKDIQKPMRAFWNSYADNIQISPNSRPPLIERALQYSAARIIQSVFEMNYVTGILSSHSAMLLQLSLNILVKPNAAVEQLLDL